MATDGERVPTNETAIRRVAEKLGREVDVAVAARGDLLRAIERGYAAVLYLYRPGVM